MLYPKATKTSLAALLRAKGYDVPSIRQARFWGNGRSRCYHLQWEDAQRKPHRAWYSGAGGRPYLLVDKEDLLSLTLEEVIHYGLVSEK